MEENITFEKDNKKVKNPRHLQRNVFILFHHVSLELNQGLAEKLIQK